jgi:oligopeptide/dipeptide ABC transporter ATP-binding protein
MALAAAGIALGVGVLLGGLTAIAGRWARPVLLRAIDTLLSFPAILTAIFVGTILGIGVSSAIVGVGVALSFSFARITSTLALSIGGREYVNAARVLGVRGPRLLVRYVLPNIAEPLLIATSVSISVAILATSALSFLGLGVQEPSFDWGRLLTAGVQNIYANPAAALAPAISIALSSLAFGFIGEALARAMNPLLWTVASGGRAGEEAASGDAAEGDDAPEAVGDEVMRVRDLVVTVPGGPGRIPVVDGVSFAVARGEMIGIVGESGSGKTMTAMAVAQILPHPASASGAVEIDGRDLDSMGHDEVERLLGSELAVVFQDPMSALNPALTIGEQMTEGVRAHRRLGRREAEELAVARLREVHIPTPERQLRRHPHELSGGMRQRVLIAMALMNEPSILIADEPTTALDVTIQAQIMDVLQEVRTHHRTAIVLISHNLALISQNCDRVLVMYSGRVVEELEGGRLAEAPLHPYTRALLAAVPELGRTDAGALARVPGEPPDPGMPPAGCPFHPRCPLALERCAVDRPPLTSREPGRRLACHVVNADLEVACSS